ncbi:MAG: DNA methyltransferase [Bacteroidales bacterium]|nr:DNA methyltransferase [Bacteroidales bacterium]
MTKKERAPRNRTLTVSDSESAGFAEKLLVDTGKTSLDLEAILNKTVLGDTIEVLKKLPDSIFDLIIIDPPYNLDKDFHGFKFKASDDRAYVEYLETWFTDVVRTMKPNASLYLCGDWKNSATLYEVMNRHLTVLNRITWQREKGRGAKTNWKNAMEDIWFGVKNKSDYYFDVDSVKMKRKVIAPYKENGKPKDWEETEKGNFRLTHPSNFWDDISIPYWSMPENTDHPTQKPEKLVAKLILASSKENDVVFDPFLGSGTTSVVAKKLNRNYVGIEFNKDYAIWAEKRLMLAENDKSIQGYSDGVFWERNTLAAQKKQSKKKATTNNGSRNLLEQ